MLQAARRLEPPLHVAEEQVGELRRRPAHGVVPPISVGEVHGEIVADHGGAVGRREGGLVEWAADLARVDVEGRYHLDVAGAQPAHLEVHEAPRFVVLGGNAAVVLDALQQGRGAVADAGDGDSNALHLIPSPVPANCCPTLQFPNPPREMRCVLEKTSLAPFPTEAHRRSPSMRLSSKQ